MQTLNPKDFPKMQTLNLKARAGEQTLNPKAEAGEQTLKPKDFPEVKPQKCCQMLRGIYGGWKYVVSKDEEKKLSEGNGGKPQTLKQEPGSKP